MILNELDRPRSSGDSRLPPPRGRARTRVPASPEPGRRRAGPPRRGRIARALLVSLLSLPLLGGGAAPLGGQEPGARETAARVVSLLEIAATEYRDAVADGEIVNRPEYDETLAFTAEAGRVFADLRETGPAREGAAAVAAAIDSLEGIVERRGPRDEYDRLVGRAGEILARAWGAVSVPEPARRPSAARGARIYRLACAVCHGPRGRGDGRVAGGLEPPPADFASELRRTESTPARDYQVTMYGVPRTAMPASEDWMSPEEAWDVAAYLQTLRFGAGEVAEGKGIALGDGSGSPIAGSIRPWSAPRATARLTDPELAARVRAAWSREGEDSLSEEEARSVVAYLRTLIGTPRAGVPEADRGAELAARIGRADSLAGAAASLARGGRVEEARSAALRAYMEFEAVEPDLRSRAPGLVGDVEGAFGAFRRSLSAPERLDGERRRLGSALAAAREEVTREVTGWGLATQSFVIILREGFEAILIIGAILAFLVKTDNEERRRDVYGGVAAALLASVGTALLLEWVLGAAPASREVLEGATLLLAVLVLFSVSYWIVSKLEHRKWERYLRSKTQEALGAGGGVALAGVAFLAVYREGFETVLFYKALAGFASGGLAPIALGFLVGCVALALIYFLFTRYGVRIPMRPFFAATSAVLYYMAVVFAGSGIRELQEAGVVGTTPVAGIPRVEFLGLYPTVETLAAQGLLVGLLLAALWITFGIRSEGEAPASAPVPAGERSPDPAS